MTKPLLSAGPVVLARRLADRLAQVLERYWTPSYSQEGEDRILARLLEGSPPGFYVDVGAYHPTLFSNTYLFYREGWSGLTVDADPDAAPLFARRRPRDRHVCTGVSDAPGTLTYYRFDDSALNTFDAALADERARGTSYRPRPPLSVPVTTLAALLREHVPAGRRIDFLSVDAEGYDLRVLRSSDWTAYRPRFVLAESLGATLDSLPGDPCCVFLRSVGYEPIAKTLRTVIYRDGAAR